MKKLFAISLCLVILLTACLPSLGTQTQAIDPNAAVQTAVAGTKAVENAVATSVALTAAAQQQVPENPLPATTEPPKPPTAVVISKPTATTTSNANCRLGPAGSFEYVVVLKQGEGGTVIGKNSAGLIPWYKLELPDGRQCWVSGDALTISGDVSSVQELASPPTPTPKPVWTGSWTIWIRGGFSGATDQSVTMNCTENGLTVVCKFTAWYWSFTMTGTKRAGSETTYLDGTMMRSDGTGPWTVRLMKLNDNQFGGAWWIPGWADWDGDWCGARAGATRPDPCKR